MKNIDKKIELLIEVINSYNPDKYFKSKFQDFCFDMFFSDEPGAFMLEQDFISIRDKVDKSDIINATINRDIILNSFSFGIFIFRAYTDFCLKIAFLTEKGMKRFSKKVLEKYFNENFTEVIFEYYKYMKRKGNIKIEQESIVRTEKIFTFFDDLSEFQFSLAAPKELQEMKQIL